jgi:hypothetical protein
MARRFPPPWKVEQIPGGYVVKDATGQSLAYVYARQTKAQADTAKCSRWTRPGALLQISLSCLSFLERNLGGRMMEGDTSSIFGATNLHEETTDITVCAPRQSCRLSR